MSPAIATVSTSRPAMPPSRLAAAPVDESLLSGALETIELLLVIACAVRRRVAVQVLWRAVEKAIPDVRLRVEIEMIGTPLTQERFLRRDRGTYGGYVMAGTTSAVG